MAATQGTLQKSYISATNLLDDREIAPKILDLQRDGQWTSMLDMLGYTSYNKSKEYWYDSFYNDPKFQVIDTTGATVTGSGTATVTITSLTSGNNNYIKQGDTLLFPLGNSPVVTTVSTTTLTNDTVVCKVDTGTLTLTAGDKITVNGAALVEGSSSTNPMRYSVTSIRNLIQIMDEPWKVTDVQGSAYRSVTFNGSQYVTAQASIDAIQRLQGKMAATWWSGQISTTLFSDTTPTLTYGSDTSVGIQKTRGMNQYVDTYGVKASSAISGVIGTADIRDFVDRLTAVKAPNEYFLFGGHSPITVLDEWATGMTTSGVTSVRLNKSTGDEANFNFTAKEINYGGYTFTSMHVPILSNPQIFNYVATGSTKHLLARSLYALPKGMCPVYGGSPETYFGMRYAQFDPSLVQNAKMVGGANSYIREFVNGGFAGVGTDANYQARLYTSFGVQANLPQLYARWTVK